MSQLYTRIVEVMASRNPVRAYIFEALFSQLLEFHYSITVMVSHLLILSSAVPKILSNISSPNIFQEKGAHFINKTNYRAFYVQHMQVQMPARLRNSNSFLYVLDFYELTVFVTYHGFQLTTFFIWILVRENFE